MQNYAIWIQTVLSLILKQKIDQKIYEDIANDIEKKIRYIKF